MPVEGPISSVIVLRVVGVATAGERVGIGFSAEAKGPRVVGCAVSDEFVAAGPGADDLHDFVGGALVFVGEAAALDFVVADDVGFLVDDGEPAGVGKR